MKTKMDAICLMVFLTGNQEFIRATKFMIWVVRLSFEIHKDNLAFFEQCRNRYLSAVYRSHIHKLP